MLTNMGAEIVINPAGAREKLLKAFEDARGARAAVAEAFDADVRTVYRWLGRLDAWDALDTLIDEKGFKRVPGPPRTRDKVISALLEARGNLARAARELGLHRDELAAKIDELKLRAKVNGALVALGHDPLDLPKEAA